MGNTINKDESRQLLAPRILCTKDPAYHCVEELDYAVDQKECKNIALTGVFGSGKSSAIDTFLQLEKTTKKVLRISLSNFEDVLSLEKSDTVNDKSYEDSIEYKVFQHILYKADPHKTPNTRFTRLNVINTDKIKKICAYVFLFLFCFIVVFEPKVLQIDSFYTAYHFIFGCISNLINIVCDIIASITMIVLLYKFSVKAVYYLSRISIQRIKAKNIEVELNKDKPVFNKLLDEILYFFEAGEYEIVVFEDLDRINKPSWLFLKLREINLLLNESDNFISNNKHITFIYAIKDDIFQDEVRTKFFDYIVPIIPIVDSFNAGEYLLQKYETSLEGIKPADVKRLGLFITRMRELVNTMNEYQLYKKTIFKELMSPKKLLAMTIYKNIHPEDYSKIHSKDGFLYYVFSHKSLFTNPLTDDKRNAIADLNVKLNSAKEGIYSYRHNILDVLQNDGISKVEIKGVIYSLEDVARTDALYASFENNKIENWYIEDPDSPEIGRYKYKYKELLKKAKNEGPENDILECIQRLEWTISDWQNIKAKLEKEIRSIESESLKELMLKTGDGSKSLKLIGLDYYSYKADLDNLKKNINEKNNSPAAEVDMIYEPIVNTIHGLIRSGFISEDYETYISYTYTGSFSEQEFNFQQSVLQGLELPFDYKLNHIESVIDTLYSDYYDSRSILNFDLLNYLLKSRNNARIDNFIETARKNIDFIKGYDLQSGKKSEFFERVFKDWAGCVSLISSIQDNEQRSFMLKLLYRVAPLSIRVSTEEREFLNTQYAFICENYGLLNVKSLEKFIRNLDIIFAQLVEPTEQTTVMLDMVVKLHAFAITYDNLRIIYGEEFESKPFSMIFNNDEILCQYVIRDINYLFNLLPKSATNEEENGLIKLSTYSSISNEELHGYFERQQNKIMLLSNFTFDRYQVCMDSDIVAPNWENVREFVAKGNLISAITPFLNKHAEELSMIKLIDGDLELQESLFNNNEILPVDSYRLLAASAHYDVSINTLEGIEEERVDILLDNKLIKYSVEATIFVSKYSPSVIAKYFINNFTEVMDEQNPIEFTNSNIFGIAIMESSLSVEQKKYFLQKLAVFFKNTEASQKYASLICEFYKVNGIDGNINFDLLTSALEDYQGEGTWFTKIDLINNVHRITPYVLAQTSKMVNSLGTPYDQLNSYSHQTILENNDRNRELVNYLIKHAQFINRIIPMHDEGKFKVTYKKNQN